MLEQIAYQDSFGKVEYPEDFEVLIEGLPIGEQVHFFRLGNGLYTRRPLHERRKNKYDYSCCLDDDKNVKSIIVKDEKISGVMVSNVYGKIVPCMVEKFDYSWFGVGLGYSQQVKISLSVIDENGRFYGKGTPFLCLLWNFSPLNRKERII